MPSQKQLESRMQRTLTKAKLKVCSPPYCENIQLCLFDPAVLEGPIPHEEAQAIVAEPAYWSFCWASGQVLAAYLLANPNLVKGKTVADIGSGSGVVAVAAALAGAAQVWACDIDEDARMASLFNGELNGVKLEQADSLDALPKNLDLIVAADILYDKDNYPLLEQLRELSLSVLLADSRLKKMPNPAYGLLATHEARTWPDLNEFEEFNRVRIYEADSSSNQTR